MPYNLQEIVNMLESLQYDILFWEKKEENEKVKEKLSDYDKYIEMVIDKVYDYGMEE